MNEHGESILKLAYLQLRDRSLAEDVFQETFTRAYLNMDGFRGESSPKTWLYRIALNLCRDRLGSWSARKLVLVGEDLLHSMNGAARDAEEEALANVDAEVLLKLVLDLPPEFREVILLTYYEDMDLAEIARVLGLPGGTVRSRLHRARQKLKSQLAKGGWAR